MFNDFFSPWVPLNFYKIWYTKREWLFIFFHFARKYIFLNYSFDAISFDYFQPLVRNKWDKSVGKRLKKIKIEKGRNRRKKAKRTVWLIFLCLFLTPSLRMNNYTTTLQCYDGAARSSLIVRSWRDGVDDGNEFLFSNLDGWWCEISKCQLEFFILQEVCKRWVANLTLNISLVKSDHMEKRGSLQKKTHQSLLVIYSKRVAVVTVVRL